MNAQQIIIFGNFLKNLKYSYVKNISSFYLKLAFVFALSLSTIAVFSQDEKQRKLITKDYDLIKLEALKREFSTTAKLEKAAAIAAAKLNGWDIYRKNSDGSYDELMALSLDGKPIYYSLDNVNAAKSTRANHLHSGGTLGLNLNGQGMYSGVWDGGPTRVSHQEFGGRMIISDNTTALNDNSFHATHVTGTIGASGVQANAKGMAPQSTVKTFDWNNDTSEVVAEAAAGLLLSNHSYGIPLGSIPGSWYAGAYSGPARIWDQIAYNAPYYLMVASAGNDGNNTNPAPLTNGYDKLTGNKTCKNNLVVANAQDANVDTEGNLISVSINSSSSEGPTDDRRIKPDITGNGSGLTSSTDASNSSYASLTGTSMASPNVMGTLILLQQHYNNVNNRFMKAATLKALACHTADDKGKVGPDPVWGWGLLNAKKAAQAISQNGLQSWITEETLKQGETFVFTAQSDGINPLIASICWTDVPGTANNGSLNSTTPALVNDLDIRITKDGITYYPWKLQSAANLAAINTEDNNVDNVERINVNAPSGTYTITVTHKGTLQQGSQNFGFVVTGLSSAFSLASTSDDQTACLDGNASYTFTYTASNGSPTTFTASGLPNGAVANFTPSVLSASGTFTMVVTNLQNAIPDVYPISIIGDNGLETEVRVVTLKISSTNFENVALQSPANSQTGVSTNLNLTWSATENADSFHIQAATDENFANIIADGTTGNTAFELSGLAEATTYYWRVFPMNNCGEGNAATVFNFQTGQLVCNNHFEALDYSNGGINDQGTALAIIQIPVSGGMTIGDINVELNITHTYIQDITVVLEGPAALNFPRVTLLSEPCGENQNIACTMDDSGSALICGGGMPSITGFVIPYESLSVFNNKPADGTWTIYVTDPYVGDGGVVTLASLDFCTVQPALGIAEISLVNFSVFPNPTTGIVNVQLNGVQNEKTMLTLFDIQGRNIISKQATSDSEILNIENLQDGVYLLSIEIGNQKTTKKIVLNR